jgi:hypothetical protein
MKTLVFTQAFLFACALAAGSAAAQSSPEVPEAVLTAFQRAQPQATHVLWQPCAAGYEANFEQQPDTRLAGERRLRGHLTLTPAGELVESRIDITYSTFPPLARTAISQQYPHRELDRIIKIVNARGLVTYETKICPGRDKNGKDEDCQTNRFDENGRPLPL